MRSKYIGLTREQACGTMGIMARAEGGVGKAWYEDHASEFMDAAAVEVAFVGMPPTQQARLNAFKLWALEQGRHVPLAGAHVLEFGGGHGRFALHFREIARYVGVDFSESLIRIGRERFARAGIADKAELVLSDALSYQGPAAAFDVVGSLGVMPHFADSGPLVAKMAYHLKPGGTLMVDYHYRSALYEAPRVIKHRLAASTGDVAHRQSKRGWRDSLRAAGLVEPRFVMREYPLLGDLYARRGWDWPLSLRNALARHASFDIFATDGFLFARKPR